MPQGLTSLCLCGEQFEDAKSNMLHGKVESGIEMLESLRAKLVVPGKGPRKGFEGLIAELDEMLGACLQRACLCMCVCACARHCELPPSHAFVRRQRHDHAAYSQCTSAAWRDLTLVCCV